MTLRKRDYYLTDSEVDDIVSALRTKALHLLREHPDVADQLGCLSDRLSAAQQRHEAGRLRAQADAMEARAEALAAAAGIEDPDERRALMAMQLRTETMSAEG